MAQTKYRMLLGTSKKQWEELTVMDDGRMMLYFHGRDRSVTQQVTAITEGKWAGWLRSEKGSMWPGLESGKWQAVAPQMRNEKLEMRNENEEMRNEVAESETTTDNTDCTNNHAEPEVIETTTDCTNYTNNEPVIVNPEPLTLTQAKPKRQRKPRKPRVERQPSALSHQPSSISPQPSSTMKAVGMVAAASVALLVIYETGLLIPLGLIGLATSGLLK